MLQLMYRLFHLRRGKVQAEDKAQLRARLIAVAVARATHYSDRAIEA
jgi:hypothetical protein